MKKYLYLKRILDVIISSILLVIFIPLYIIIGVIIKIDSKGPVIFVHRRIGKGGKTFGLYKFRTMVDNAEELIKDFNKEQMEEYKRTYKLKNDPRITKVGKILRRTSLDELPQILNVIKGDLSIVGPRPIIEEELEKYKENKDKLLSIRPGITGFWVANSNKDTTYEERIKMELGYVDKVSLKMDIDILLKTFRVIINRAIQKQ